MDANERRSRATEEATHWWTRLGTRAPADVSETDRQEFTQWLRESPLHVAELLQIAHVHDALERFTLWDEIPIAAGLEDDNVVALPATPNAGAKRTITDQGGRGRRKVRFALAASAALIAIATGWLTVRSNATTIETDRAERREIVLTDGSVVNLEPETALRISFGTRQRHVDLLRGRALFHVAKDAARAFIVRAGDTNVRAVGTIFGVEQKSRNIVVTVSEGKVAVAPASGTEQHAPAKLRARAEKESSRSRVGANANASVSAKPGEVFLLTADQQITVGASGEATPVHKVDSSRALAWSEGRLVFDSTPLGEVAAEFNRYNRVQLRIASPALASRTVSGVFQASDPQTLIDFIGAGAHVVVTRNGEGEIVISPGP